MSELTKKELIVFLEQWFFGYHNAHNLKPCGVLNKETLSANDCGVAYQQIRQLIENQPEVDMEFVEKWIDTFDDFAYNGLAIPIDKVIEMFKEAGVKVING